MIWSLTKFGTLYAGFDEAAKQCRAQSGGHLAIFETDMEFGHLRNFLRQHVVANIRKFSVHLQSFPLSWTFLNPENQNTAYNIEGSAIIIIEHQLIYKWQLYIHLKRKLAKADEEEK